MQKRKVRVVIWGLGAMGSGMAKMISQKEGFELVGVCDRNPHYVGKSLADVLKLNLADPQVIIKDKIEDVVSYKSCDVVLLATDSYTIKSYDKIMWLLNKKVNVISTAEEMAYPHANNPQLAEAINKLATEKGVSVLGTGVNPGMMMDLLVVFLSGVCEDIKNIDISRVNSLSPFGKTVMDEQGVGLTIEEYNEKNSLHKIAGHVGFRESAMMICEALGLEMTSFTQEMSPIISEVERISKYGKTLRGNVAGVDMRAHVKTKQNININLHHPQQIEPQLAHIKTGDYINISGVPEINMAINPEVEGGIGTIAICVNMIPHIINASPGLKTMIDLPVPRAILGDVRNMIEEGKL